MAELESQLVLEHSLPIIDDPQIFDEQFGISAQGGMADLQTFFRMPELIDLLPPHNDDWTVVELKAYSDERVDYTPALQIVAGVLEGVRAIDEDRPTVFVDFLHARLIAQFGIPFEIVGPKVEPFVETVKEEPQKLADEAPEEEPIEEDEMDGGYFIDDVSNHNPDLPVRISMGTNRFCQTSEPGQKPVFERQRVDLRSRRKGKSILQ